VLLAAAYLAAPHSSRAADADPTDLARAKVAQVFGVGSDLVAFTDPREENGLWKAACRVAAQTYQVQVSLADGRFRVWSAAQWKPEQRDIGLQQAQRAATRVLQRLFSDLSRLRLTSASPVTPSWYCFSWDEHLNDTVLTGTTANIFIAQSGSLYSYGERIAHPKFQPDGVSVSREQALSLADRAMRPALPVGSKAGLPTERLVLSSLLAPDRGPVWQYSYPVTRADGRSDADILIVIDAMRGSLMLHQH